MEISETVSPNNAKQHNGFRADPNSEGSCSEFGARKGSFTEQFKQSMEKFKV